MSEPGCFYLVCLTIPSEQCVSISLTRRPSGLTKASEGEQKRLVNLVQMTALKTFVTERLDVSFGPLDTAQFIYIRQMYLHIQSCRSGQ